MRSWNTRWLLALVLALFSAVGADGAEKPDFDAEIARIDEALRTNPSGVLIQSLQSCQKQRRHAIDLYRMGMETRARRALRYCYRSLMIPESAPIEPVTAVTQDDLAAAADAEYDEAIALTPDPANGLRLYRECAACHEPEGWGRTTGSIPQIAGQHRSVIIRQLADFRAGNRDSVLMVPYAATEAIGGAQAVSDLAAYVASLEISVENGTGPGTALTRGEALYGRHCANCHGVSGEGDGDDLIPRIQAQHYKYLLRQFEWIRSGKRRNASSKMIDAVQELDDAAVTAILDYVSRLTPAPELQAPPGWRNPDFE